MLIICNRKGSPRSQGSKGLSRHKPAGLSRNGHLFHVPLTAPPSSAFCCLTEDHLNDYAHFIKRFADKKQVCVFITTKTTPMPSVRGKLAIAPGGCYGYIELFYGLENPFNCILIKDFFKCLLPNYWIFQNI